MGWLRACFSDKNKPPPPLYFTKPLPFPNHTLEPSTKAGHLYLIKEREFIKTNERIFKIGKSTSIKSRMPSYPKNSLVHLIAYCHTNIDVVEKLMIKHFDGRFKKRLDIGHEYYECTEDDHRTVMYEFMYVILSMH